MQLTNQTVFACGPERTLAILADAAYWEEVAMESHPISYEVIVDWPRTRTERVVNSEPPASKLTGPTLTIVDEIAWDDGDGPERVGAVCVGVVGLPIAMAGCVRLTPEGSNTVLAYEGELTVDVPLIGKLIERQAAPVLLKGLEHQQIVADRWTALDQADSDKADS
ncbi:MAG: DUF2505 domain-containing protein [Propionibacteriaceae bacterium]|nr:DUF2505 domain-containing protein [Propionibacteriaceae bacterium]